MLIPSKPFSLCTKEVSNSNLVEGLFQIFDPHIVSLPVMEISKSRRHRSRLMRNKLRSRDRALNVEQDWKAGVVH